MTVVIRRRTGLVATVAVSSALLAGAYLWFFAVHQSEVALLIGALLGVVAVLHGCAVTAARTPLLVADETGLRVRLGAAWTGVPWNDVERVEVEARGRLSDGAVAVQVRDLSAALSGAGLRSRVAAWCNARLYGASLAVPFGLATTVTTADVAGQLERLANGRAEVVVPNAEMERPEPTVEVHPASKPAPAPPADGGQPPPGAEPSPELGSSPRPSPVEVAGWKSASQPPLRRVVSAFRSSPAARREEVTVGMRHEATDGMLALSSPPDEVYTEELPEIAQLRRGDEQADVGQSEASGGNVDLIIDATTDLSARAMTKVRKLAPGPVGEADGAANTARRHDSEAADPQPGPLIGAHLRKGRENLWLTVDDLAERTRIRPFVIECLEADDFSPCGGDFYARGHLRMLARVLGIDPEPLIATYDDKFATAPVNARAVFDVELATGTTGMVRGGAAGANWGGLVAAVLVVLLVWGVAKFLSAEPSPAPAQSTPTSNSAGLGSPGSGNAVIPSPPDARVRLIASGGDSRVVVRDSAQGIVFKGVLRDGQEKKVAGQAPLRVFAVNGGVIRLSVRGHRSGVMGELGEAATKKVDAHRSGSSRPADNRAGGQPNP